jgi:RNA polymerase sigma-B factor
MPRQHLAESAWARYRPSQKKESFEQPDEIWAAWINTRDPALKNILFRHNQRLASKVAHQWAEICEIDFADLEQLASIGLLKAIDGFNPSQGNKFSSYAMPWVKGEILHFLRDKGRLYSVPRKAREIKATVVKLHRYLLKGNGAATLEDCAAAKGLSAQEWAWICEVTEKRPMAELKEAVHVEAEEPDWEQEEAYALVRESLMSLPDPGRSYLIESVWKGLQVEAIAKKHNQPIDFVNAQLQASMTQLKSDPKIAELKA